MSKKWHQVKIELPDAYSSDQREAIASEIISFIRQRTIDGKDVNNKSFPKYSKSYISSVDFRAAGKSKDVNLTLSGDMLAFIDLIKNKKGEVVIGYDDDSNQAGKAEGNIRGTYGQAKPISGKARNFLGINEKDLRNILKKYPVNDEEQLNTRTEAVLEAQEKIDKFADKAKAKGEDENIDPKTLVKKYRIEV